MKGSLVIVSFFVAGCLLGMSDLLPSAGVIANLSKYVLYALMFFVGFSIGRDPKIKGMFSNLRLRYLLLPVSTVCGTLIGSALISLFLPKWSLLDCLAVGSGFAYYSLSSILITEIKTVKVGIQSASELGTIALLANIIREVMTLLLAPLIVRFFGPMALISAGGATTMDTTLPVISRYSGKEYVFLAILHGILLDFSVPFFVSFFSSL